MPKMILNRNHIIRAEGRDVQFEKGIPVEVHPSLVKHAVAAGAEMVDGSKPDVLPAERADIATPAGEERKKAIMANLEKLALRNQRGDFNGSGVPDLRRLNPMLGFDITREERDDCWKEYLASKETV
jgi:hypothetical protein